MKPLCRWIVLLQFLSNFHSATAAEPPKEAAVGKPLITVAEQSDFKATSRYDDVMDLCRKLSERSPVVTLADMGASHERRKLPLLILADPAIKTPEQAKRSGKLVVFAMHPVCRIPGVAAGPLNKCWRRWGSSRSVAIHAARVAEERAAHGRPIGNSASRSYKTWRMRSIGLQRSRSSTRRVSA